MLDMKNLIQIAGVLHFGLLLASALTPRVLDWRTELRPLSALSRHLIWVHGSFIVFIIIAFGTLSIVQAHNLADGSSLARWVCGMIALFWLARLVVQLFIFDARPFLMNLGLKLGYHGLTVVFTYFVVVYSLAAIEFDLFRVPIPPFAGMRGAL